MSNQRQATVFALNYPPEHSGIAPYTASLVEYLVDRGASVEVMTAYPHYPTWRRQAGYRGLRRVERIHGAKVLRLWHWIPNPPRGVKRLLSELSFGAHQALQRRRPAESRVMVTPALFATALCMARSRLSPARKRTVVWVQDLYYQGMIETAEGGWLARRLVKTVEGWTLRSADSVVAIHPAMRNRMIESFGVEESKLHVIPNWTHITPVDIGRDEARARLGWSTREAIVLHAGNMGRKQGLGNVVQAASMVGSHEPIVFVLLGDGSERTALEEQSRGNDKIRFIDALSTDDFPLALAAADALLINELPGVKEMAVPSKLTSYLAAGRPIIAAVDQAGSVAGVIDPIDAGQIIPSGSPLALVEAARRITSEPQRAELQGAAGRDYWRSELSADAALSRWEKIVFPPEGKPGATGIIHPVKGETSI